MARKSKTYKTFVKKGGRYYFSDENVIVTAQTISAASEHYIGVFIDKDGQPFTFTVMDYALDALEVARYKLAMEIVEFICMESPEEEMSANEFMLVDALASELADGITDSTLNQMIKELETVITNSDEDSDEQYFANDLLARIKVLRENNK